MLVFCSCVVRFEVRILVPDYAYDQFRLAKRYLAGHDVHCI